MFEVALGLIQVSLTANMADTASIEYKGNMFQQKATCVYCV